MSLLLPGRGFYTRADLNMQAKPQEPINLRSDCGFLQRLREASVCHLACFTFFSLNSHSKKKKAKIASISPYGLGLFCFGIYEHIPSSGWMRNRETSLWNVQAQPGQMGPFEIYDPAPRLTTLSTLLHWGKLPPVFLDKEGEQHFLT